MTAAGSLTDLVIAQDGRLQRVIVAGFGKGDECKPNNLRKAAGSAARALIAAKIKQTAVVAPILSNPARVHYLAALAEGLVLGGINLRNVRVNLKLNRNLIFLLFPVFLMLNGCLQKLRLWQMRFVIHAIWSTGPAI